MSHNYLLRCWQVSFALILTIAFSTNAFAQSDTPCECASRWEEGGHWNADGTITDSGNIPEPQGIIRCGNAADTQSNVSSCIDPGVDANLTCNESCTYDPTNGFEIDLSGISCFDPNSSNDPNVSAPAPGCDIMWLQFDVRPFAGTWQFQLVGGSQEYDWALYATTAPTADGNGGNCSSLELQECGSEFSNTWSTITTPSFAQPTNYYMAVWNTGADCTENLSINFKFRNGCGDAACFIQLQENGTGTTCNADGTYDVCFNIEGANGVFTVADNTGAASNVPGDFTLGLYPDGPFFQEVCVTYPQGVDYDVNINGISLSNSNDPCLEQLNFAGVAPVCCSLDVTCPDPNGGNLLCAGTPPAPDASLIVVNDFCGSYIISASDSSNGGSGCANDPLIITRTYTITDDNESTSCTQTFTSIPDETAPVITACPTGGDLGCNPQIPAADVDAVVASDDCGIASVTVAENTTTDGCVSTLTYTYTVTDNCGNDASCEQVYTYTADTSPPVFVDPPTDVSLTCDNNVPPPPQINVTDDCGTPNITFDEMILDECGEFTFTIVRTWTATDACGNTSVHTQNIEGSSEQTVTCPDDIVVPCDDPNGTIVHWETPTVLSSCDENTCPDDPHIPNHIYIGEYNGHRYYCSNGSSYQWNQANAAAQAAGGYLVVINDAGENQFVQNAIMASAAWIGLTDQASEGNFEWVNGDPLGYTNWQYDQPNNYGGYENYVALKKVSGKWMDRHNCNYYEYVMEIPCGPSPVEMTQTEGPGNGCAFPEGTTTVSYEYTDECGNVQTCSFDVTVEECPIEYCEAYASCSGYEWIKRVYVGGIDNWSGASNYSDFTYISGDVVRGQSNYIYLRAAYSYQAYYEHWYVWIDYNHDGDFDDPGELAYQDAGYYDESGYFTVPTNALTGPTRMRIIMDGGCNPYPFSCGHFYYGEVEDYTINIVDNANKDGANIIAINEMDESGVDAPSVKIDKLYPNPAINQINVEFMGVNDEAVTYTIYDLQGKLILQNNVQAQKGLNNLSIELLDIPQGSYFLEISNERLSDMKKFTVL